jgi:hypothetical protein
MDYFEMENRSTEGASLVAAVALIWCGVGAHLAGPGSLPLKLLASDFRGIRTVLE